MAKAKTKKSRKNNIQANQSDSTYFLKIVMYMIFASMWLRIQTNSGLEIPLPIGGLIAVIYALHDHFQIDRKIELAITLVAMFISFWLPIGLYINIG